MGAPGLIPGGNDLEDFAAYPDGRASIGQFAKYPGATPKFALNKGPRDAEFRETMARLFIQVPPKEREKFVSSCPPETRPLAEVLCGAGAAAAGSTGFIDFLLTSAQESFQEKVQVVESLSDNFIIYTFGQRAPTFSYGGTLLNTYQDDQRVWMLRLYQDILRGTQLARRRKVARLRYDSVIVSGIFTMHAQGLTGDIRDAATFQFSFIPTQYVIFSPGLGMPTILPKGSTPGAQFQLSSTDVPNDKQFRVTAGMAITPTATPAASPPAPSPAATPASTTTPSAKAATPPRSRSSATSKPTPTPTPTPPEPPPIPPVPPPTPTTPQQKLESRSQEPTIDPRTGLPPSVFQTSSNNPNVRGGGSG